MIKQCSRKHRRRRRRYQAKPPETEIGQLGSFLDLLSCVLPPRPLWLKFKVGYINQPLVTNLILLKLE